jgi:hypothetical protein
MLQLVATHGRDNPFGNRLDMEEQFENALRVGLDRVGADYAMEVPFRFAFYGDLWRPDGRSEWEGEEGAKDLAALELTTELELELAQELVERAGLLEAGEKALWDDLPHLVAEIEKRLPGVVSQGLLERFASDTAEYFSFSKLRTLTMQRVATQIEQAGGEVVLLAHSMGTIVGYDLLMSRPDLPVVGYITFGSPLGFRVVLDRVGGANGTAPFPPNLPRWFNIYNQQDLVASVRLLEPLYISEDGRRVEDVDTGKMRKPSLFNLFAGHQPGDYLSSKAMGNAIRALVDSHS